MSMECGNDRNISNQCVVLERDGSVRIEENVVNADDMEMGSVLLTTILGEVCGTDVHLRHGRLNTVVYPIIPGHVAVGTVHTLCGDVVDVEGVQVDKQSTRCPKRRVIGITCKADHTSIRGLLGGWTRYIYLPPNTKIIRLPSSLPPQVFMAGGCGLPTAMHAVDRANIRLMDRVIIQGSGPVGLLAAVLAQASGALQVIVIGAPAHRLEVFRKFGFEDTINIMDFPDPVERRMLCMKMMGAKLADVVIEATGRPEAVSEGMELCRDGGTYVVVGQYTDNGSVSINPHFQINRKHITIKGSWGSDFSHFYRGVQFMDKKSHLPWDLVVSKCFSLEDAEEAIACVEKLEIFKALLKPAGKK